MKRNKSLLISFIIFAFVLGMVAVMNNAPVFAADSITDMRDTMDFIGGDANVSQEVGQYSHHFIHFNLPAGITFSTSDYVLYDFPKKTELTSHCSFFLIRFPYYGGSLFTYGYQF